MKQKNSLIEATVNFLSLDTSNKMYNKSLNEQEDKAVTNKVNKAVGTHPENDELPFHLAKTPSGHHVYHTHTDDYAGYSEYVVHHPDGKITKHHVDHDNKDLSSKELANPRDTRHNVSGLHPSVRKVIQRNVNAGSGTRYNVHVPD